VVNPILYSYSQIATNFNRDKFSPLGRFMITFDLTCTLMLYEGHYVYVIFKKNKRILK
jgi:hypothetical protein